MVPKIGPMLLRSLQEHAFALHAPANGNGAGAWHPATRKDFEPAQHRDIALPVELKVRDT